MNIRKTIIEPALKAVLFGAFVFSQACQTADLIRASGRGNPDIVKSILEKPNIDINERDSRNRNALIWASSAGHVDVIRLLVARGARIEDADAEGNTPLHYASFRGRTAAVEALLALKADPERTDRKGRTALIMAVQAGARETVAALLKKANPGSRDADGWTSLHYAVWRNDLPLIDLLLAARAPRDATDKHGLTPLMFAAKAGRYDIVRRLLAAGARPDARDWLGNDAATFALMNEHPELAKLIRRTYAKAPPWDDLLLASYEGWPSSIRNAYRKGMPPVILTNRRATPLVWAARSGEIDAVRTIYQQGFEPSVGMGGPPGALFEALGRRHWGIARLILKSREKREKGAPPFNPFERVDDRSELTPAEQHQLTPTEGVVLAAVTGNSVLFRESLSAKGDANASSSLDETPLMLAAEAGQTEMIAPLIAARANPQARDRRGWNALFFAIEHGQSKTAVELVRLGVPVGEQDYIDRRTPILRATMRNDLLTLDALVQAGANGTVPDLYGNLPIIVCAKNGFLEALNRLRPRIDLNQADPEGRTALHWSVFRGSQSLLGLLTGAGAFSDPRDHLGLTPLAYAVRFRNRPFVEALLTARASPNTGDGWGTTPLMTAAAADDEDLLRLLLDAGASVNLRNRGGQSALSLALTAGAHRTEKLLRARGAAE